MFERIDFQTPRRPDENSNRILHRWQSEICSILTERWETLIPNDVKLSPLSVQPVTERMMMKSLPIDGMGAQIKIGAESIPSLIVMSGRLIQTLIESVLHIEGDDWPTVRNMSTGEMAILEILLENFNDAIRESWFGDEPISCTYETIITKPTRSRIFPVGTEFLLAKFGIETRYGAEEILWLTAKQQIEEIIEKEFDLKPQSVHDSSRQMAELTEKIAAEIIVQLGSAELKMSEAMSLTEGDILLLDQSVRKPLTAFVANCPKWRVSPVTIGTRVGFQVDRLLED